MTMRYFAVGNIGAHNAWVDNADDTHIWSNENPSGWTYQQIAGTHGTILGEYDTFKEAKEHVDSFLECDSVETGTYCYTHNPEGV